MLRHFQELTDVPNSQAGINPSKIPAADIPVPVPELTSQVNLSDSTFV
jgi:hypothetical protein